MKKIFILIIILALGFAGWHYYQKVSMQSSEEIKIEPGVSKPDPSGATFSFEDGPVTLKDGKSGSTEMVDMKAYGDLNNDGKNDTAVILVQSGSGSGIFIYIGAYVSGPVRYNGSNTIFVGDRVSPTSISIKNGLVNLAYLDRGPDEPMAAEPTISKTKQYVFKNGELEEK